MNDVDGPMRAPASALLGGIAATTIAWSTACGLMRTPAEPSDLPSPTADVDPIADEVLARLDEPATLYWPHGPRGACEAWSYTPADGDDPARLELHLAAAREGEPEVVLAFRATLRDRALFLTAPIHERRGRSTALPCTFAGQLLREGARTLALELRSDEGLYLDADACAARRAPPLRPLGCAGALADPTVRARLDALARAAEADDDAGEAEAPWALGPAVYLRIAGDDERPTCTRWRRHPGPEADGSARYGVLRRRDGATTIHVDYQIAGGWLTLASPTAVTQEGPRELRRARSCVVSQEVRSSDRRSAAFDALTWHRSRSRCEADQDPLEAPPPCLRALVVGGAGEDRGAR